MTTAASNPPLDLDQAAALLTGLRPAWRQQGLIIGPLSWRDASESWPRQLHYQRRDVAEPESLGLVLTGPDGREARLVIWRGGWADVDLLTGGLVITRNPGLDSPAACAALATALAAELTAPPARWGTDLGPVTIDWICDWWDGPVAGMATYQDRGCWFQAIFDTDADEWTNPRRCRLYELTSAERDRLQARHREWEQHAGGGSCYHPGAPGPATKPGPENFQATDQQPAQPGQLIGEFTAPPLRLHSTHCPHDPGRAGDPS